MSEANSLHDRLLRDAEEMEAEARGKDGIVKTDAGWQRNTAKMERSAAYEIAALTAKVAALEKNAARWLWLTDHRRQGRWKFQRWCIESGQWDEEKQEMGFWLDIDPTDLFEHVDMFMNVAQSHADGGSQS